MLKLSALVGAIRVVPDGKGTKDSWENDPSKAWCPIRTGTGGPFFDLN